MEKGMSLTLCPSTLVLRQSHRGNLRTSTKKLGPKTNALGAGEKIFLNMEEEK